MTIVRETNLPDLVHRGKVRDTYDWGEGRLLMLATDRISAFDVVLPNVIPDKGAVLSQMSGFWFRRTKDLVPNHLLALGTECVEAIGLETELARRAMVVRQAQRIDVECIVRGYIAGSAWAEYRKSGTLFGQPIDAGLAEGDRFEQPLFTPTTKAEVGHDLPMSKSDVINMIGIETANEIEEKSIAVYEHARIYAAQHGIIIADTKMEFGWIDGELNLIDELVTPDSSRFWDSRGYGPGKPQPNFDKQFVRDWLDAEGWDRTPPPPTLPNNIVNKTRQRYIDVFNTLTGGSLV